MLSFHPLHLNDPDYLTFRDFYHQRIILKKIFPEGKKWSLGGSSITLFVSDKQVILQEDRNLQEQNLCLTYSLTCTANSSIVYFKQGNFQYRTKTCLLSMEGMTLGTLGEMFDQGRRGLFNLSIEEQQQILNHVSTLLRQVLKSLPRPPIKAPSTLLLPPVRHNAEAGRSTAFQGPITSFVPRGQSSSNPHGRIVLPQQPTSPGNLGLFVEAPEVKTSSQKRGRSPIELETKPQKKPSTPTQSCLSNATLDEKKALLAIFTSLLSEANKQKALPSPVLSEIEEDVFLPLPEGMSPPFGPCFSPSQENPNLFFEWPSPTRETSPLRSPAEEDFSPSP